MLSWRQDAAQSSDLSGLVSQKLSAKVKFFPCFVILHPIKLGCPCTSFVRLNSCLGVWERTDSVSPYICTAILLAQLQLAGFWLRLCVTRLCPSCHGKFLLCHHIGGSCVGTAVQRSSISTLYTYWEEEGKIKLAMCTKEKCERAEIFQCQARESWVWFFFYFSMPVFELHSYLLLLEGGIATQANPSQCQPGPKAWFISPVQFSAVSPRSNKCSLLMQVLSPSLRLQVEGIEMASGSPKLHNLDKLICFVSDLQKDTLALAWFLQWIVILMWWKTIWSVELETQQLEMQKTTLWKRRWKQKVEKSVQFLW